MSKLVSVGFLREVKKEDYTRARTSNSLSINDTQWFTRSVNQIRAIALRLGYDVTCETVFSNVVIYMQSNVEVDKQVRFTRVSMGNGILHYYATYEGDHRCILI